jgi:uncharacterized membrane protein
MLWKRLAPERREKWLRRFFQIGVAMKGVDGILETIGGALFLAISRSRLTLIVFHLTRPELMEDPDDLIANALRHAFSHLSASGKLFGSIYLLVHGAVKIFLVIYLLRNKLWAFPAAIAIIIAFIGYQIYRLSTHFNWTLLALTILDIIIILLVWHEWRYLTRRRESGEDRGPGGGHGQ